jgi:hypothetical protein
MGRLGRAVTGQAVVEGAGSQGLENRRRGGDDVTVEDDRDPGDAGGENGTGHGGKLAAAQTAQDLQRIVQMIPVEMQSAAHRLGLAGHAGGIEAGARSDPFGGIAAMERAGHGGRHGGVADPHLAETEEVDPTFERFHAEDRSTGAVGLVEGRFAGEIAGRDVGASS